jgi:hypothetical protein
MLTSNLKADLSMLLSNISNTDSFFDYQLSLDTLHVNKNKIGDAGVKQIARAMETAKFLSLTDLNLSQCDIGMT